MKSKFLLFILLFPLTLFASDWTLELRGAYYKPVSKKLREAYSGGWIDYQLEAGYFIEDDIDIWVGVNWISKKKKTNTGHFSISSEDSYSSYYDYFYSYDSSYYFPSSYSYSFDDSYSYTYSDTYYGHYIYDKKQIWILPLTIGSRYYFCLTPCLNLYVGAGVSLTFVELQFSGYHVHDNASKVGVGALLKSGLRYNWGSYTFIDLFADYFFQEIHLSHSERDLGIDERDVNIGGFKIGLGVGVYF